jgi:hypothetical protein
MLITEEGLTFRRVASCWVCVEYPELRMLTDGTYAIRGQQRLYRTGRDALAAARRARIEPQHVLALVAAAVAR